MKVYKVEIMVIDHDGIGPEEIKDVFESQRYPNHCMNPHVMEVTAAEIGRWKDSHPLNYKSTQRQEYLRLFQK